MQVCARQDITGISAVTQLVANSRTGSQCVNTCSMYSVTDTTLLFAIQPIANSLFTAEFASRVDNQYNSSA